MEYFCIQPKLFSEFQCIGNECPDNCCHGWGQIIWLDEEYDRLCSASCSEKIRNKIKTSFKRNGKYWIVDYSTNGYCAFLTEDKMCSIQRELGPEYLSSVCMVYPRIFYSNQNFILRTCNSSCYYVMDMLVNKEEIMTLEKKIINIDNIKNMKGHYFDKESDKVKNPALIYRVDIFNFLYDVLSDKSISIETALTLGALTAQQISKFEAKKQYDKIPMVLETLKPQLNNPEQIKKIEAIQPNYSRKFVYVNELLSNIYENKLEFDLLMTQGQPSRDKYDIGYANFEKAFSNRSFALRNIALNILTECFIGVYDKSTTAYENFCYIVACFACIKLAAVSIFYKNNNAETDFKKFSASLCRQICHNKANVESVRQYLKEHNCTSPAHLALLIK